MMRCTNPRLLYFTYSFSDKIAEMTLRANQGHWRWHNSVG